MYLALVYDVTDDYLERRGEFREEHLRLARAAHERGELALGGAFTDPPDSTLLVWSTGDRSVVERFVALDPYVANGLVTAWRIREWNVVVGGGPVTGRSVIDHVAIQAGDIDAATAFYDAVLAPLGFRRVMEYDGNVGYGVEFPGFWVGAAEHPADTAGSGLPPHIAFTAPDRAAVVAFFEAAVATGAEVLHEPRVWPEYHPSYFGGFVRDPDGNNVEACCHRAP